MEYTNISTRQQQRNNLDKIRELVMQFGPNSYLSAAFKDCFEIAAENIEKCGFCSMSDRIRSMYDRVRSTERRAAELEDKLAEAVKDYQTAHETAHIISEQKDAEIAELKDQLNNVQENTHLVVRHCDEIATAAGEAQRRSEAAEAEVIRLKAKLYDLMIAAK